MNAFRSLPIQPRGRALLALGVLFFLFVLLFQYRAGSVMKHLAAGGVISGGDLLPPAGSPAWLAPVFGTVNFLHVIWMPFLLGILIAATLITSLPEVTAGPAARGPPGSLSGVLFGLPNMFCSCCAGPVFAGLYRGGASLEAALSVYVAAPALNIAVLIVAFSILPMELALARLVLGLLAVGPAAYLAARICAPWLKERRPATTMGRGERVFMKTFGRLLGSYCDLLDLKIEPWGSVSLGDLVSRWLMTIWQLGRVAVPLTVLGTLFVEVLRALGAFSWFTALGGGPLGIAVVSALGTIVMIASFNEIPLALGLLKAGMGSGPAAAILITAPTVSLPSLLLVGWAVRDHRVGLVLGTLIFLLGLLGGLTFSAMAGPG